MPARWRRRTDRGSSTSRRRRRGVSAAIARPQVILNCNAAIFERSKDLLVVDTHSKPSAVIALVSQIRREVSAKPVRYIVNSHFHWDHTQGSPAYRRLAPNADVIASETTRRLLSEFGAARLKQSLDQIPKQLDGYREKAAAANPRRSGSVTRAWQPKAKPTCVR